MSEEVKTIRVLGKEIARSSIEKALYSATAFLVIFNAVTVPFALPKMRVFVGAPFVPSSTSAFRAVLEHVPELRREGLRMVDVGSGDGRLVLEASKQGMQAMGVEMNPWLVLGSRLRMRLNRTKSPILWANAWRTAPDLEKFQPDLITFYGRPGQGVMTKFGALAEEVSDKTGKDVIVASNKFPIPGWNVRLVANVHDFYIYKLHSNAVSS